MGKLLRFLVLACVVQAAGAQFNISGPGFVPDENGTNLDDPQAKKVGRISIQAFASQPDAFGEVTLTIRTNADTSSLKLNGDELGGKADGVYTAKRVARAGQETKFTVVARDLYGNTDTKVVTVSRPLSEAKETFAQLNATNLRPQRGRDAVAIIIGIQDYLRVPRSEFSNEDARSFYEYARRGLGIDPGNIKLLVDSEANDVEITRAFKSWLPSRVNRDKTDVYVFYSGHGLPSDDGKLYLLPYGADSDFLERTAVARKEVVNLLQAARPKAVTMFIDSCYNGLTRSGETLLPGARPIVVNVEEKGYPDNFVVLSASGSSEIASSSPDLKHGIFSYYLMKGMEGDADENKNGTITFAEMHGYLIERVARFAATMNRRQVPQLLGDGSRILIGNVGSLSINLQTSASGTVIEGCTECPEMVVIPSGSFVMGSERFADEKPSHSVAIRSFFLGKTEVTQGQWYTVTGNNPSHNKDPTLPVEQVSWDDIQQFIVKLNQRTGQKYRLPSESEWEYAARAGTTTEWSSGDDVSKLENYAWYYKNSGGKSQAVGQKLPNQFGLFDMHGNVWEWTQDCWHANYAGAPKDGSAWTTACAETRRVIRGGSWKLVPNLLGSANRNRIYPESRDSNIGFRLARDL